MSTPAEIRTAIVIKVLSVANVGRVHDYQRYDANLTGLQSLYRTSIAGREQIRGWFVTRTATAEDGPQRGRIVVTHTWQIRGYLSLDDSRATEKEFDALIEALAAAFRADETLGGVVATTAVDEGAGLQLEEHVPVMFAGVLCHMARLTLRTRHYL